jgi:hypothetical protein
MPPNYEAITRQNALEKLIGFKLINDAVLKTWLMRPRIICGSFLNLEEITSES